MKTHFRLYNDTKTDFNSTIFDLINGDRETKQTKGLAYVFSQYSEFLFSFLEYRTVKVGIFNCLGTNLKFANISSIEVCAERITTEHKRADIVIKIDERRKPLIAIIIEAKSINAGVNQQALSDQISNYLDDKQFPELQNYKKVGVVLTKYNQCIPDIINISWENIVQLLFDFCKKLKSDEIIKQYLNFLTQIEKSMKYYEKEVLSIPSGENWDLVQKFNIYVCPDTKGYPYKIPLFVAFRQKGGYMSKLYKIEDIIILNPTNQSEIQALKNSTYPDNLKNRIIDYINIRKYTNNIEYEERFYLLSETESINLMKNPRPIKSFRKFAYYTLKEILTKERVTPETQQ